MLTFLGKFHKANIAAASAYGLVSLFASFTYALYLPHAVGQLAPAIGAFVTGVWGLHCWQLGVAAGSSIWSSFRASLIPLGLSCVALGACWNRYIEQIAAS